MGDLPIDGAVRPDVTIFDAGPVLTTIKALRMNVPASGVRVALRGVVVTFREIRGTNGVLIIQDAGLGPFSGITLRCNTDDQSDCNLRRQDIDQMPLGRVVDVDGQFDLLEVPSGQPQQPRIIRATIRQTNQMVTVAPTVIRASDAQFSFASDYVPLLWTFVRVEGPLHVIENRPALLQTTCAGPLDAGTPTAAFRGIMTHKETYDIAVGMRPQDFSYCIWQCDLKCANDAQVGDNLAYAQGIFDYFVLDGTARGLIIVPAQDSDIGPRL